MIGTFARQVADIEWLWGEAEGEMKRDVRSLQSSTERQIEMRANRRRHQDFNIRYSSRTLTVKGTDVGCGCDVHCGHGDEHPDETPEIDPLALAAARRERRITATLAWADARAPFLTKPPWTCPALPSHVLRLRFREVLPECRDVFGLAGLAAPRGRSMAACIGVRLTPRRGPGMLAHLTDAARGAWVAARTVLPIGRWVDRLGGRHPMSAPERALAKEIARQCEALELRALGVYAKSGGRLPPRVERAGRSPDL